MGTCTSPAKPSCCTETGRPMSQLLEMDGDDVGSVVAAMGWTNAHLASVFGKTERTIYRWKTEGAPPHVALVLDALVSGKVRPQNVKQMLHRIGRSRRDGNRY